MEFLNNVQDMLSVAGEVTSWENKKGIQMELPDQVDSKSRPFNISRIECGEGKDGETFIRTVSNKGGVWPVYGEPTISEILTFSKKAMQDLPDSEYSAKLYILSLSIEKALKQL